MTFFADQSGPEHFGAILGEFGPERVDFWCDFGAPISRLRF